MIKIAFFDVDGTLLKLGSKEPSPKTVQALQQLQANGVLLCMATGRGYLSIPHFEGVDFDIWLTFNGSYVRSKDAVISKNPLDADDKRRILHNLKQMHRAAAISNEHFIVTNGTDPDLEQYFSFGNEKLVISEHFDALCEEEIYQIMCSCNSTEYAQILQGTHATQITAWWDKAVDIIPANGGKGNAVNAVLKYYGFSKEEAIAFGDGENDIEMLEDLVMAATNEALRMAEEANAEVMNKMAGGLKLLLIFFHLTLHSLRLLHQIIHIAGHCSSRKTSTSCHN